MFVAIATVVGIWSFARSDPGPAIEYWKGRASLLPLLVLCACADVAFEGVSWYWTYRRLGVRARPFGSLGTFLAGRAGLLLPAQLGRLIRPDAMFRLGYAPLRDCMKAEAVTFVLDVIALGALACGLVAVRIAPALGPVASAASIAVAFLLANGIARTLAKTSFALPASFWWSWRTWATVLMQMGGWTAHGVGLWLMIHGLTSSVTLVDTVLFTSISSALGASSGLPGGIGATEGLLGLSLTIMKIPPEHLAIAIGSFRLITFWAWIPIGWIALGAINAHVARHRPAADPQALAPEAR